MKSLVFADNAFDALPGLAILPGELRRGRGPGDRLVDTPYDDDDDFQPCDCFTDVRLSGVALHAGTDEEFS